MDIVRYVIEKNKCSYLIVCFNSKLYLPYIGLKKTTSLLTMESFTNNKCMGRLKNKKTNNWDRRLEGNEGKYELGWRKKIYNLRRCVTSFYNGVNFGVDKSNFYQKSQLPILINSFKERSQLWMSATNQRALPTLVYLYGESRLF